MQTRIFFPLMMLLCIGLTGCNTEDLAHDARQTPIGSVVSGDTHDAQGYFDRVEAVNKSKADRGKVWVPTGAERQ